MENEIGKRYGILMVIKRLDRKEHETSVYLCKLDCGNFKEVNIINSTLVILSLAVVLRIKSKI